jgi:hypothetical protein
LQSRDEIRRAKGINILDQPVESEFRQLDAPFVLPAGLPGGDSMQFAADEIISAILTILFCYNEQ